MPLPFEYNLDPPEETRKYIECDKCGYEMYYEDGNHEQTDCFFYGGKYYCEECFVEIVKQDHYWQLA